MQVTREAACGKTDSTCGFQVLPHNVRRIGCFADLDGRFTVETQMTRLQQAGKPELDNNQSMAHSRERVNQQLLA